MTASQDSTRLYAWLTKKKMQRHRLTPERKLASLEGAKKFIHEVGIATLMPTSKLPSLFGAVQGKPYKPGSKGFGLWPSREWWWAGALAEDPNILYVKLLSGKGLYVAKRLWSQLDKIVRHVVGELEDGAFHDYKLPKESMKIFEYIRETGPTRTDLLRRALGFSSPAEGRAFHRGKEKLQALGVLVGKTAHLESHIHVDVLYLWNQLFPRPMSRLGVREATAEFLAAAVEAAVLVSEDNARRWFPWSPRKQAKAWHSLIESGRLHRFTYRESEFLTASQ